MMFCFNHPLSFIFSLFGILQLVTSQKIVIVGAGASGIAAATRLIDNNITDFVILEAEGRLGGRIHSVYLFEDEDGGGGHVDLGAEYVGGEEGNVVYEFAKKALSRTDTSKTTKTFYSNGEKVDDGIAQKILNFKENLRGEFKGRQPISAKDAFDQKFNSTILGSYKNDPTTLKIARDFEGTCENIFLYRQGAFDWSKILLNDHYQVCKGDQGLNWNGEGFRHLLDLMMRKHGDEKRLSLYPIFYSKTVEKITWENPNGNVTLSANNGKNKFEAQHVIFTPSVGVLKHNHKELFEPKLSAEKVKAIEETGFDGVLKVFLQYEDKWWGDDVSNFVFVWNKDDEKEVQEQYKKGPRKDGKHWLTSLYRVFITPGMSKVLTAWFTGPLVPEIEKLNTSEISEGVSYVIEKFLGKKYKVSKPELIIHSSWYSNPNFRGVYSYETTSSTLNGDGKTNQEKMAEPLVNKRGVPSVVFAGEHTHKTFYSAVHGAVESGYRAADELVQYLNKV